MAENRHPVRGAAPPSRTPWQPPRLRRLEAGAAEVGTRATVDGPLATTS